MAVQEHRGDPVEHFFVLEERIHLEALVDIHLDDLGMVGQAFEPRLDMGPDFLAGGTPFGTELDEEETGVGFQEGLEVGEGGDTFNGFEGGGHGWCVGGRRG